MNVILSNGKIYPQFRVGRRPTAVVISGNRIDAIGTDTARLRRRYPGHRVVDLGGRVVLPGLVDSHTHFYFWASRLDSVHLDGYKTFSGALREIGRIAAGLPADTWVVGDGWSADRWEEYHLPTAGELDGVTGGRPAALFSKDQHLVWANSRALQLAGIDENSPDPEGGKIDRDPGTGRPTGILRELPGFLPVTSLIGRPDPERMNSLWERAARIAYSRGVTGFHSMDNPEAWEYFHYRHKQGKLGFRVQYYFPVSMLEELAQQKIASGDGDATLRAGGVKIFCDGSLGAQTALLKKPYRGKKGQFGVTVTEAGELARLIAESTRGNLACAIHAIGDQAVANVIAAFEKAGRMRHLRHRIEHLQLISRGDIPRLKRTGVVASMQPSHCPSDRELVAAYWGRRGRNAFIFKTLLRHKVPLAFGSDCPIEPLDPLAGIHAAVNRNGYGERGGRFYPGERLTVAQAVYGFTAGPAYAAGREAFSGRIAPGYQADLAILEDDIYSMAPSRLHDAAIAATVFDGKVVYRRQGFGIF